MQFHHFISDDQLNKKQLLQLISLAKQIKHSPDDFRHSLAGKSIVMLFEKPSLRTHVSFDIGIQKLGGHALYIGQQNGQLGERERVVDVAKNLACWSDAIVARVFRQSMLEELAEHAGIPVINALSDLYHPCQALADILTIAEHFTELEKVKLAYVGDGNNVANSLMLMAATLGLEFTLMCPANYGPNHAVFDKALQLAGESGATISLCHDIDALGQQDVIYTDTWISMGDSADVDETKAIFMPYQVNHQLMAKAGARIAMHCQPAHLDFEISTALFDSELSVACQQAENRMWAQNAILVTLMGNEKLHD